jgi:protein-tyrosine-phosphatase
MATKLTAPPSYTLTQNGIEFTITHKLSQSRERDWAPFDEILTIITDDAGMVVAVANTKSNKAAQLFAAQKAYEGLTRSPASLEVLARRAQLSLF